MAAQPPPKPWERRIPTTISNFQSSEFGPTVINRPGPPVITRVPPPLPPRVSQQTGGSSLIGYRPSYSSFTSSYGPYGSSLYSSYSPYSYGYGAALGYNRFRTDDVPPSRFVQQAEESSRGAFQSIESIVHAFTSVSMMMDATFSAVYNSFRAVLDVANHFSRLKVHFTKVFSAFAVVRTLRYLYRKLKGMMGLQKDNEAEDLWADSTGAVVIAGEDKASNSVKSWPIFLFLAVILGGPYLIWKLLSSADGTSDTVTTNWANGDDDHVVARAEFDFNAASDEEISFHTGDMLNLAPKEQQPRVRGWLLASLDGQITGLIPANYVKILGKRRGRRQGELGRTAQQQSSSNNTEQTCGATSSRSVEAVAGQDKDFEELFTSVPVESNQNPALDSVITIPDKVEL
uniref:Peroxisomal membrane protein PEX13 n=1 Tax=Erpetoichthys calabaricus TaxID=27687 RepID=A0A8C4TC65_ERPCA